MKEAEEDWRNGANAEGLVSLGNLAKLARLVFPMIVRALKLTSRHMPCPSPNSLCLRNLQRLKKEH